MDRAMRELVKQADDAISQRDKARHAHAQMRDVLLDVAVYLDDRSDVIDGPEGQPMPNKAMQLLREVERVLAQVTQ